MIAQADSKLFAGETDACVCNYSEERASSWHLVEDGACTVPVHVIDGLEMIVERGPNWLFVKLRLNKSSRADVPQIAEKLWSIASRHFIYRLVLELDELADLPPGMIGQLVMLQQRLRQCGGALRICGLSADCEESLHGFALSRALQNHASRAEAVMGSGEFAAVPR